LGRRKKSIDRETDQREIQPDRFLRLFIKSDQGSSIVYLLKKQASKVMKTEKSDILRILSMHKPLLTQKYQLNKLGLFGSYARGEAVEGSDIDILVDFKKPVGMEIVDLALELEKLLNHKVDIITLNAIKNRLFSHIEQEVIYV
jgi:predicted nucleotidyltransferase